MAKSDDPKDLLTNQGETQSPASVNSPKSPEGNDVEDGDLKTEHSPTNADVIPKTNFIPGVISTVPIVTEMQSNYLDYSMSVIVSRALPDVRDGLKPSQRRILVSMQDLNLHPKSHHRKSAKIVGDTSGNYHPHGGESVYPTLVKMAQDFSLRYPLIDGQGNFGSIDGDPPAAMRYTEARMSRYAKLMLEDLDKGTVLYRMNYDGTRLEPYVLPTKFPNLLTNGSDGIAVGMATKIPPHNLEELVRALRAMISSGNNSDTPATYNELRLAREKQEKIPQTLPAKPTNLLDNYLHTQSDTYEKDKEDLATKLGLDVETGLPAHTSSDLPATLYPRYTSDLSLEQIMEYIQGPDFPTGGTIYNRPEVMQAYATGRGRILIRAKAKIVQGDKNRMHILVTEIPYQVNKSVLLTKIANLVRDKKITGISNLRDESSEEEGIRIVIILKKDAQPKTVLNKLYKYTQMQLVYNANMIALVDGEPIVLGLKRMLELFLQFRMQIIIRRYEYNLAQARYRGHILEGLLKALDILDEVIATIRASKTQEVAKENLINKFDFTHVQAQAILDMQLRRLAALERQKLQNEFKEVESSIKEYNRVLGDQHEILMVIDRELQELEENYTDERRTKVVKGAVGEFSEEDLVQAEETFVTISRSGYIKRVKPSTYKLQKRGGKGIIGAKTKEGDFIEHAFSCNTHDNLMIFTNKGRVFMIKVHEVPEMSRTAKGTPIVNLIQIDQDEVVSSVLTRKVSGVMGEDEIQEGQDKKEVVKPRNLQYLFMGTKHGTIKKTPLSQFEKIRQSGLKAIGLADGDELVRVRPTTGEDDIIAVTKMGRSIRFNEKDVRAMGRSAKGVRGIKFKFADDEVISYDVVRADEQQLFILSEYGYGKMTKLSEYPLQKRGGSGVYTFKVRPKTGNVSVARIMDHPHKEIVVISEKGNVIRSTVEAIPTLGRQTSGVKTMTLKPGDKVAAMAIL